MRYGESAISFYFHELLFPSFVPIPPSPSIRATFSIQPRRHPLDYRLLSLRAHPAQLVLRVRRANNLFPLPSRNDLLFLCISCNSLLTPSVPFILRRYNVRSSYCACTPRSFPLPSAPASFCSSPHPPSQSLDSRFLFSHWSYILTLTTLRPPCSL